MANPIYNLFLKAIWPLILSVVTEIVGHVADFAIQKFKTWFDAKQSYRGKAAEQKAEAAHSAAKAAQSDVDVAYQRGREDAYRDILRTILAENAETSSSLNRVIDEIRSEAVTAAAKAPKQEIFLEQLRGIPSNVLPPPRDSSAKSEVST